jgi:hypothetical protein
MYVHVNKKKNPVAVVVVGSCDKEISMRAFI